MSDASEEALLHNAANFDETALSELYDRYEGRIYSYVYRRTGDSALAEDLTAQVFLKMLKRSREVRAGTVHFQAGSTVLRIMPLSTSIARVIGNNRSIWKMQQRSYLVTTIQL
jgi:methyl coenzyme M reductase alpha subunit